MRDADKSVQCVFVVQNHEIKDGPRIADLGQESEIPVLMVMPGKNVGLQREICADMSNVYFCAWERAFSHSDEALQNVAAKALVQNGIGDLFEEVGKVPYEAFQLKVERRLKSLNTLPTLPEIVMRIMRLVNDPNTTPEQLEQLLCTDPAIVMKLLQVIKSPVFSATGRQSSWTLSEIIVRLGLKKVGAIAQQIKMINSLVKPQDSGFDLRRFWEHSVGTAIIADKLYMEKKLSLKGAVEFNEILDRVPAARYRQAGARFLLLGMVRTGSSACRNGQQFLSSGGGEAGRSGQPRAGGTTAGYLYQSGRGALRRSWQPSWTGG